MQQGKQSGEATVRRPSGGRLTFIYVQSYDAADRLLQEDSAGDTKTYAWDANGNHVPEIEERGLIQAVDQFLDHLISRLLSQFGIHVREYFAKCAR